MILRVICLLFLLGVSRISLGQNTQYKLPVYFGQFYNDPFLNPSNFNEDQKGFATIGHRRNSNNFGGVNTSFAAAQFKLGEAETFNEIGFQFFSDNEGPLLSTTRGYLNYARHLKLNDAYQIAGGLSFGFYNFAIKSDGTNDQASKATFDGSMLLKMYNDVTSYQLIINQLYNTSIQPFVEKTVLVRNINLFWHRKFQISEDFISKNNVILRWSRETILPQSGLNFALNSKVVYKKLALVGVTYQYKTGNYFSLGIEEIPGVSSKFGFELAYLVPSKSSITTSLNQFEVVLNYKF